MKHYRCVEKKLNWYFEKFTKQLNSGRKLSRFHMCMCLRRTSRTSASEVEVVLVVGVGVACGTGSVVTKMTWSHSPSHGLSMDEFEQLMRKEVTILLRARVVEMEVHCRKLRNK